mgnify:CR=1 FL=1|tara:strand:+ start:134 stop:370 length:237 start_codon:yes stop_codon:yes gene_type:complete
MDEEGNYKDENQDSMMFMVPDILVARMEQARRLIKDMKSADQQQKDFLIKGATLLLDSCDPRYYGINMAKRDNVTPLN